MGLIVLDTNVVAELPGLHARAQVLRDWIGDRKRQGHEVVVVPQVIAEGEQLGAQAANARLATIEMWCSGLLGHDASDMLRRELVLENPAREFRRLRKVQGLFETQRHRKRASFQTFLASQRDGYAMLDGLMPDFARKIWGVKYRNLPFGEFIEGRRRDLFRVLVGYCVTKGYVAMPDEEGLERLWVKALSFRLLVLLRMVNEYRIGTRIHRTVKGSMKDARVLFESAYADEFVTQDQELFECGRMLEDEGLISSPKFVRWPVA
jgi:hypothetical protein